MARSLRLGMVAILCQIILYPVPPPSLHYTTLPPSVTTAVTSYTTIHPLSRCDRGSATLPHIYTTLPPG
ncbi:hypothetical protein CROQUDRAFT_661612 [Cronartium quercuum f. sp. fusiforme G11]|uniref:Uncharacterized protein n=1 Tax=Cronartium quercuum f. sp. fusiforme G11 TaxID=708437 RepID=A0A9P6TA37_9BASI|nr:hypothetical protein CROQUDRAFT_661612 [Cronartium quercuum f. sp. fusiforme G11]